MKSKQLIRAIGGINDKFILAAQPLQKDPELSILYKRKHKVQRYIPAAASLVIIASVSVLLIRNSSWLEHTNNNSAIVYPQTTSDNSEYQPAKTDSSSPSDSTIRGLPVENFSLSDIQDAGVSMDRIGFIKFGDFFRYGIDTFAVIQVDDIHTLKKDKDDPDSFEHQISDIRIIQSVYGNTQSDVAQITQSVITDHFCLGTTNLLRKGGVYVLPIEQYNDTWVINGDMDVLFEVDDQGKVWSHSDFKEFSQFDGKNMDDLISHIQQLTADQDFMLANSPFSDILNHWTLADITVDEHGRETSDEYGAVYTSYAVTVNDVLSYSKWQGDTDKEFIPDNITVNSFDSKEVKLTPGVRYLMLLDLYQGNAYINPRMIAEIKKDLKIESIPASDGRSLLGESIFTPYNGYSIAEINELISRIDSWNESHPDQQ